MFIDIGFKNFIDESKIYCMIKPNTSKAKWLIKDALVSNKLINCTQGKKTSSIIILNTFHIVLSCLKDSSIKRRMNLKDQFEESDEICEINDIVK